MCILIRDAEVMDLDDDRKSQLETFWSSAKLNDTDELMEASTGKPDASLFEKMSTALGLASGEKKRLTSALEKRFGERNPVRSVWNMTKAVVAEAKEAVGSAWS